jgi:hypothetical protein
MLGIVTQQCHHHGAGSSETEKVALHREVATATVHTSTNKQHHPSSQNLQTVLPFFKYQGLVFGAGKALQHICACFAVRSGSQGAQNSGLGLQGVVCLQQERPGVQLRSS